MTHGMSARSLTRLQRTGNVEVMKTLSSNICL